MKMSKKIRKTPMRRCIVTREHHPKHELVRIVRSPEGIVSVDSTGKANGRGAYLKKSVAVIEKARKTKALERHLGVAVPEAVYEALLEMLSDA